jgi:hypothetical protein
VTREQYLLIKLAEECAEVSHVALKATQLGLDREKTSAGKNVGKTNKQLLVEEIKDLITTIAIIQNENVLPTVYAEELREWQEYRKERMDKWYEISKELGYIHNA